MSLSMLVSNNSTEQHVWEVNLKGRHMDWLVYCVKEKHCNKTLEVHQKSAGETPT